MKKATLAAAPVVVLLCAAVASWSETRIGSDSGAGLGVEGRQGFIGPSNTHTSFVVTTDESVSYALFIWDGKELDPWVRIEKKGTPIVEVDLAKGNRVTLKGAGTYALTISAHAGSGHWMCVLLGGQEWDP